MWFDDDLQREPGTSRCDRCTAAEPFAQAKKRADVYDKPVALGEWAILAKVSACSVRVLPGTVSDDLIGCEALPSISVFSCKSGASEARALMPPCHWHYAEHHR